MSQTDLQRAEQLRQQIADLQRNLDEHVAALPHHSVKPSQMLRIEELEDEIARLKVELNGLSDSSG